MVLSAQEGPPFVSGQPLAAAFRHLRSLEVAKGASPEAFPLKVMALVPALSTDLKNVAGPSPLLEASLHAGPRDAAAGQAGVT